MFTTPETVTVAEDTATEGAVFPSAKFAPAEKEIGVVYDPETEDVLNDKLVGLAPVTTQPLCRLLEVTMAEPKLVL